MNNDVRYRQIAIILMMTVFFAQTFSSCFIVARYYANTQAYAQVCVNKTRPQLHCNGKCQMRKQIGNEEKKDQQLPERKDGKNEVVLAVQPFHYPATLPFIERALIYPSMLIGKEAKMPRLLLRPPIV